MNHFDKRAKDELHNRLEQKTRGLKNEIWNELEIKLFSEEPFNRGEVHTMKKKHRIVPIILITAAVLAIVFSITTKPGMAIIKGIKDMFVPEKEIIQSIEGQDEPIDVHLNEGTNSEYVIYLDETRYKMIKGEEVDIITTIEPLPEKYPEVSMAIKQVTDTKPEDLVKKIEAELKADFPDLRAVETVTEPVEGYWLHGTTGNEWNSKVVTVYVISNGKEGSFVITENYFLEAAEGHGARFHHMLQSFKVIE